MDSETKELFNALIGEFDRVEQRIYEKLDETNEKIDALQKDINLLLEKKVS